MTINSKKTLSLKRKLARYIEVKINDYISQIKEEIEKEEQQVLRANLKKIEMKKKNKQENLKPFELKTGQRIIEKQIKQKEHPVIGRVTVKLGPNRSGKIIVRQGDDPTTLARNFIHSYSLKQSDFEYLVDSIKNV